MLQFQERIAANLAAVRARIAAASLRAGRHPADVQLIAVTKYAQPAWIEALIDLGQRELGENRPQQLAARAQTLPPEAHWHLVGHLQRNKVRLVAPYTTLIHSVDSLRLLDALDAEAAARGDRLRVLCEVNLSGEAQKHGFRQDELVAAWSDVVAHRHLSIEGLMTMAAETTEPEQARPTFRGLRELRDALQSASPVEVRLTQLSMGMSGDFEPAVEEGATLVRIGSALFAGAAEESAP